MISVSHSRITWASDIHLDHADQGAFDSLCTKIKAQGTTLLLLTGDIDLGCANPKDPHLGHTYRANGIVESIRKVQAAVGIPVFFILGNHDFYFGSFASVRKSVKEARLDYIHGTEGIELNRETALAGHDGWADARAGTFFESNYTLSDFFHIKDLTVQNAGQIFTKAMQEKLQELGDASRKYAERVLPKLFKRYRTVIFLTHVPPFREASCHEGKVCNDAAAPFFVNQTLGEGLLTIMRKRQDRKLIVLCGHTHSPACYQPLPNLKVLTAGAEYGNPEPQAPLTIQTKEAAL